MLIIKKEVVVASAGIEPNLLKVNDFKILLQGKDISKVVKRFLVRPSEGRVDIHYEHNFTIKGIKKNSQIQKDIKETPKWLKNNSLYTIGLNKNIKDKHPFAPKIVDQLIK